MGARAYIGTSGWYYKHWFGEFYPDDLAKGDMLVFYARQFSTVEINATFYRLPFENMVKGWRNKAPEGFVYSVKGSRTITHLKKLKGVDESIMAFFGRISGLGEHLGPILWQLPPSLHRNEELLDSFLSRLPRDFRHAVEFRHESWMHPDVFDVLRRHEAAHVSLSSMRMPMDLTVTADFVYARFHGLEGGYAHDYTEDELAPWVNHIQGNIEAGRQVFAYFNNDGDARAPKNAHDLERLLEERGTQS